MTKDVPTVSELRRAGIITGTEIARAGTLYETAPTSTYRFASGHSLDLAEAIAAYAPARSAMGDPTTSASTRRVIVANAIMLARPQAPSSEPTAGADARRVAAYATRLGVAPDTVLRICREVAAEALRRDELPDQTKRLVEVRRRLLAAAG